MRKIAIMILALMLALALCACEVLNPSIQPTVKNETPTKASDAPCTYTVTIQDDTGKPLENIMVMISTENDKSAGGGPTDANGTLTQELLSGKVYQISLMNVPDEYEAEKSYCFTDCRADIILKTITD